MLFVAAFTAPFEENWSGNRNSPSKRTDVDCNLVQIPCGLAQHHKQYQWQQSPTVQQSCARVEINARETQAGFWKDDGTSDRSGRGTGLKISHRNRSCESKKRVKRNAWTNGYRAQTRKLSKQTLYQASGIL